MGLCFISIFIRAMYLLRKKKKEHLSLSILAGNRARTQNAVPLVDSGKDMLLSGADVKWVAKGIFSDF